MDGGREPRSPAPCWLAPHMHSALCARHGVLMDVRGNRDVAVQSAGSLAGWVGGRRWPGDIGTDRQACSLRCTSKACWSPIGAPTTRPRGSRARSRSARSWSAISTGGRRRAGATLRVWHGPGPRRAAHSRCVPCPRCSSGCARAVRAARPDGPVDRDRARWLVRNFTHLRPIFYGARRACPLDSLTLLQVLAGFGLYPWWAFGVRTSPFHVYCWPPPGPVLFNDLPERARRYSPIVRI